MTTAARVATGDLRARAADIGRNVAGPASADVDKQARFPREAIDALRDAGMMSALVPADRGGAGAGFAEVAAACEELGHHCASTAMIFAMHQIQAACLVKHGRSPELSALTDELVADQLLFASATTEIGIGGDVRSSTCAVETLGDRYTLEKNAPVISYGAYADAVFATARRTPDSPPSDQSLVVCRAPGLTLEQNGQWDTLGFRGTCSPGFLLRSEGPIGYVLDDPYADISARTMLPVSHSLWASLWLGIATEAVNRARASVRKAARAKPGTTPPAALRLAEVVAVNQQFADLVHGSVRRYEESLTDSEEQGSMHFAIAMNSLKVAASTLVVDVVGQAMLVAGITGYREDSAFPIGRLLRDAYGAALMVNNDRIIGNSAQLLLVTKD
jgi:acyl-CoA dehydrogenase